MSTQTPLLTDSARAVIAHHGFAPFHTGGGCWAFFRQGVTEADAFLVTAEGCIEDEADACVWQGWRERYDVDPQTGHYASDSPTAAGLPLTDAIIAVLGLPRPGEAESGDR